MSKQAPWLDVPSWDAGIATFSDGSLHFVVTDPSNNGEIVAMTGRAEEGVEGREKAEQTAKLIAAIPPTSAMVQHVLQQLEDLVRQYPEGPNHRTPAGQAARDTLAIARQLQLHKPT